MSFFIKGRRFLAVLLASALAGILAWVLIWASHAGIGAGERALSTLSLTDLLAGDSDSASAGGGYAKALAPMPFVFPRDHGPHPDYRNEWWYFTGNLRDKGGKEFGYQLTFFRSALAPPTAAPSSGKGNGRISGSGRTSPWASRQAYMAHLAVTDAGGSFHAYERFSRGALGLAGAEAAPFQVWLEDWKCESLGADSSFFPLRLRASQGSDSIDLILEAGKRMVLQGDSGFSRKGPEAGNASYYYSFTRMPTHGTIKAAGEEFQIAGNSWMDREWGSSILAAGLVGWDWFGLQLSDSTDLLLFRLRSSEASAGGAGPVEFAYGMLVDPSGNGQVLRPGEIKGEILSLWKSPRGRSYPAKWLIEVPARKLRMEITPKRPDQEMELSIPYWEGAVEIKGDRDGKRVRGEGYMELTGYR